MRSALLALGMLGATALALTGLGEESKRPPSFQVNWMQVLSKHPELDVKIERSTRLAVPAALREEVWMYLRTLGRPLHGLYDYEVQTWQATDFHYDTPDGRLAAQWLAVRLRTDSTVKLQIKAYDRATGHAAEISVHPTGALPTDLFSLVAEADRPRVLEALHVFGVKISELSAGPPIYHARRRAAIRRGNTAVVASLDQLTWDGGEHHVLELSEGDPGAVDAITSELLSLFPRVRIDPSPKIVAVVERTLPRVHETCVWAAAGFMCRPAAVEPKAPVPAFLGPRAEPQAMPVIPVSMSTGLGGRAFVAPLSTR